MKSFRFCVVFFYNFAFDVHRNRGIVQTLNYLKVVQYYRQFGQTEEEQISAKGKKEKEKKRKSLWLSELKMRREKLGFVEEFSIVGKSIPLSDSKKVLQSLSSSSSSSSSSTLSLPCSTSITLERLSIIENPMRHSRRINQLYSTICPHEHQLKHEIANHIRDVKNRTFLRKVRNKAKRTLAAKVIQRLRKTKSSGFSTAKNAFNSMIRRRRRHRRQFPINQRNSLQIPSITFPRYSLRYDTMTFSNVNNYSLHPQQPERLNLRTFFDTTEYRKERDSILFVVSEHVAPFEMLFTFCYLCCQNMNSDYK